MSNIVEQLIDLIEKYDTEGLNEYLNVMPIEKLTIERSNNLLLTLLENIKKENRDDMVSLVIKRWSDSLAIGETYEGEYYPIITKMIMTYLFDDDILGYVLKVLKIGINEILTDLIDEDKNDDLVFAINRVMEIYGVPNIEILEYVRKTAEEKENDIYVFAIDRILQQDSSIKYADIPEWIDKPKYIENETDLINKLPKEKIKGVKSIKEAVELLTQGLYEIGLSFETIDENKKLLGKNIETLINNNENNKLEELVEPSLKSQAREAFITNNDIFRILGPVNSQANSDLTPDTICYKYGGCRMYYCNCFAYDEEQDEIFQTEIPAWFTGYCQICNLKIKKRTYAIRRPGLSGGWHGCYCSEECLKMDLTNIVNKQISVQFISDLHELGIVDRNENLGNINVDATDNGF